MDGAGSYFRACIGTRAVAKIRHQNGEATSASTLKRSFLSSATHPTLGLEHEPFTLNFGALPPSLMSKV